MEKLGELSLDIKYKEGPLNVLADTLSVGLKLNSCT